MGRLNNFLEDLLLVESTNKNRYEKYFSSGKYTNLYVKTKKANGVTLYDKQLNPLDIKAQNDEEIKLLNMEVVVGKVRTQKKDHYFVPIQYKGKIVYIDVNDIRTPHQLSRGESLGIQSTNLIQTGNNASENIVMWGKTFSNSEFKEFTSDTELANTIIQGFKTNKKVPDYVSDEMERILNSGTYSQFDWGQIESEDYKNQIGKYYGELLVGLCLLNEEYNAFVGDIQGMLKNQRVVSFLMPLSPSFPAADSVIKTDKKYIPISNKKGGGTGASFYTNVVPLLTKMNNSELRSRSNILVQLKEIYTHVNNPREVITQIYLWGFKYLLGNLKLSKKPGEIYKTILNKKLPDKDVDKIVEYIKNRKWNNILRTHLNAVEQNLPYSLTHFFLYHLYYILSNDAQAQDVILDILSAKEYWQVDLQNRPWRNGTAVFNLKKSDKTELTFSPTRGKIDDIRSSHAKLNYILK